MEQQGLFSNGGFGSSWIDVKPLVADGSNGGYGWSFLILFLLSRMAVSQPKNKVGYINRRTLVPDATEDGGDVDRTNDLITVQYCQPCW